MFTSDFSKMFDPSQYTQTMQQNMQKFFDWTNAASASKQNLEAMKQVGSIVTDTIATCTEKQFKYAQSTMEDCVEALRELSTAKGIEDYMSKQTEISKRSAEKAQSMAQEISTQWQKTQAKCSDIISQQTSQTLESLKMASTTTSKSSNASSSK